MVVVFVSFVVVSVTVLPSLLCVVVVTVLFSVVPFWLSQPMVNTPSAEIRTNARKRFISMSFQKSSWRPFTSRNRSCWGVKKIRALSFPVLPVPCLCLGSLSLRHASCNLPCLPDFRILLFTQPCSVRSHGECTP